MLPKLPMDMINIADVSQQNYNYVTIIMNEPDNWKNDSFYNPSFNESGLLDANIYYIEKTVSDRCPLIKCAAKSATHLLWKSDISQLMSLFDNYRLHFDDKWPSFANISTLLSHFNHSDWFSSQEYQTTIDHLNQFEMQNNTGHLCL